MAATMPEDPGEDRAGAQDGEGEGKDTVFQIVVPGGVDYESGGDEYGGEHE